MTRNENPPKPETAELVPPAKRPYHTPRLDELGSVRALTLAAAGSVGDGVETQPA
jgi:hypothetical protein